MNSDRLTFKHYTKYDFDEYLHLVSNADVMKMVTGRPLLPNEIQKRYEEMLKTNSEYPHIGHFKVTIKDKGSFVGHSKLEFTKKGEAEIGYLMMPEFWGKGYGNEIAKTLINIAKNVSEIDNLIAIIDPENTASKKILEKQGFNWESDGDYLGLPAAYYKLKL